MNKFVRYIMSVCFIISGIILLAWNSFWYFYRWNINTIYTNNVWDAINTELWGNDIWDPIREWAYNIIHSADDEYIVEWIVKENDPIETHWEALWDTMQIIRNAVNWALWMLSLVALIYIIIQGFMILTAAGDDNKQKKWIAGIKRAWLAIIWIGVSRFIVSFIFRIIRWVSWV
jgi:hypothetical protein